MNLDITYHKRDISKSLSKPLGSLIKPISHLNNFTDKIKGCD